MNDFLHLFKKFFLSYVFFIAWLLCGVVLGLLPIIGFILMWIVQIIGVVLLIIGILNAVNEKQKELPIIGGLADKLKF